MINAETLAEKLWDHEIKGALRHEGTELGWEITQILQKNLLTLESNNWEKKVEQALEAGKTQFLREGELLEDFSLEQLRNAMILVLTNHLKNIND